MNDDQMSRAAAREWLVARIVVIGGLVTALAIIAYLVLQPMLQKPPQQAAAPQGSGQTKAQKEANAVAQLGMMICVQELFEAKDRGFVPNDGQLAVLQPFATKVKNRLACVAATTSTKYIIAADVHCTALKNASCLRLHDIKTSDGLLLYQRRD
jgi:hypothetical protein